MEDPKVYVHASYVGTSGYNNHTRDFFRHLSKFIDIKVRNFTVGKNWNSNDTDEPHNDESWISNIDKKLLIEQTLFNTDGSRSEYPLYKNHPNDFKHNVNIVLNETNHYYYYDDYSGPKIAYNVWESSEQPSEFFKKLLEYDEVWVPSKWQAKCTIEQGADPNKVKVVPEGVDVSVFFPEEVNHKDYNDKRFKFVLFGRWDYRKSTKEIIEAFLNTFSKEEPVDLIISIDNPEGKNLDGFETTEERLKHYGFTDDRIKIRHFPSREDYVKYLKKGHIFLSCARSEGWNLPLIEAMACGTPSIYSADSAQMEFAEGKGLPVKIKGKKPANADSYAQYSKKHYIPGNFPEPDFEDLEKVMRDAYKNYEVHKKKALKDSKIIYQNYNWDNIAEIGYQTLSNFIKNYKKPKNNNKIVITYNNGPKVEILGGYYENYKVEFIDSRNNKILHEDNITNNMWTSCSKRYYIPWVIKINGEIVDELNLENKNVLINFKSSSVGDTIAWFPYVEEFRKKHNCNIICKTFKNSWFDKKYQKINFKKPNENIDCNIQYNIGWFYDGESAINWDRNSHPNAFLPQPLQKTSSDILGLKYKEIQPLFNIKNYKSDIKGKYVTISIQSTAQCKYWNHPTGWQQVVDYLNKQGYKVVLVDQYTQFGINECINIAPKNVIIKSKAKFDEVISIISKAEFHLGVSSGLSWVAWATCTPVIMVSSFTKPYLEFTTNCIRIYNDTPTSGYFNYYKLDPSDWNWYPYKEINILEDWYDVENITPKQVINRIKDYLKLN